MKTLTREQYRAYLVRRRDELEKLVSASKPAGHQTAREDKLLPELRRTNGRRC